MYPGHTFAKLLKTSKGGHLLIIFLTSAVCGFRRHVLSRSYFVWLNVVDGAATTGHLLVMAGTRLQDGEPVTSPGAGDGGVLVRDGRAECFCEVL